MWANEEYAYVERINSVLRKLAKDEADDKAGGYGRLADRQNSRTDAANSLREDFEKFCKNEVDAATAGENALVIQGFYQGTREWLKLALFKVDTVKRADADLAVKLVLHVTHGLPPPDDQPSQEKMDLFVDIGKADTVISTVLHQMQDRAERMSERWWFGSQQRAQADRKTGRATSRSICERPRGHRQGRT